MKVSRVLMILLSAYCSSLCAQQDAQGVSREGAVSQNELVRNVLGEVVSWVPVRFLGSVPVVSYVTPEARSLYAMYQEAKGVEGDFIERARKSSQIDCSWADAYIEILKKNAHNLEEAGKQIDKRYASSYELSSGLMSGGIALVWLYSLHASINKVKDIYWRRDRASGYAQVSHLKKLEEYEKQLGISPDAGYLSDVDAHAIPEVWKDVKAGESYMGVEREALAREGFKIEGVPSVGDYITAHMLVGSAASIFGAATSRVSIHFLQQAYRSYQIKKLEHEWLAKDKEINQKMLEMLEKHQGECIYKAY